MSGYRCKLCGQEWEEMPPEFELINVKGSTRTYRINNQIHFVVSTKHSAAAKRRTQKTEEQNVSVERIL